MIRLVLKDNVSEGLGTHRSKLRVGIVQGVTVATLGVQTDVRTNYLQGDPLHQRTGNLNRNILGPLELGGVEESGDTITGTVGIGSTAAYGKVHEFGGTFTIPAHFRRIGYSSGGDRVGLLTKSGAVSKRVAYISGGMVREHEAHFPTRSFIRASLTKNESSGQIKTWVEGPIVEALR